MLEDSPWAAVVTVNTYLNEIPAIRSGNTAAIAPRSRDTEGDISASLTYIVQFRSAVTIRKAIIRSAQLRDHYDAMPELQKRAFDAGADKFLQAKFPEEIIISITAQANNSSYAALLQRYWSDQSVPKLSMKTFLNVGSEKLPLIGYAYEGNTIQLTFARPKQFAPETDLSVEFVIPHPETIQEFASPQTNTIEEQRERLKFKPKKMMIDGEIVI